MTDWYMMKPWTHSVTRLGLCLILLLPGILAAQDLEAVWRAYLAVDTRLEVEVRQEQEWVSQQQTLYTEIRQLEAGKSWYGGWMNEMLISRKSAQQVQLEDSLQQIRYRIERLREQREEAFVALKDVYQQTLARSESAGGLSPSQREQTLEIGRQLIQRWEGAIELPDYASILNNTYEDEAIRRLVLNDLRSVLQVKLGQIDSLITEKEAEQILLSRLVEFHRDISYQLEANRDLSAGDRSDALETAPTDVGGWDNREVFGEGVGKADETRSGYPTGLDERPLAGTDGGFGYDNGSIEGSIQLLKLKRQQYQDILLQIETELQH